MRTRFRESGKTLTGLNAYAMSVSCIVIGFNTLFVCDRVHTPAQDVVILVLGFGSLCMRQIMKQVEHSADAILLSFNCFLMASYCAWIFFADGFSMVQSMCTMPLRGCMALLYPRPAFHLFANIVFTMCASHSSFIGEDAEVDNFTL